MAPIQTNQPVRVPKDTNLVVIDEEFEKLLVDAVEKAVKAMPVRRARRIHGLLTEFRDLSGNAKLHSYYRRVVGEVFLDAIGER